MESKHNEWLNAVCRFRRLAVTLIILATIVGKAIVAIIGFFWDIPSQLVQLSLDMSFTILALIPLMSRAGIKEWEKIQNQIKDMAYYDVLTGLPNRNLLDERLDAAISHARLNKEQIVVMFLDLNRFKAINDTLGHKSGDILLKEVVHRLENLLTEQDDVYRMGGDEFTLFFTALNSQEEIARQAEEILDIFIKPFKIIENEFFMTASLGISVYPYDGETGEKLIKNAEIAMYRAKENGRDRYEFYTLSMNARAAKYLTMENSLRKALENEEFILHYQPQVDIEKKRIIGCEALLRWNHPEMGMIPPGDFISLAEETGLIVPIGQWVLKTASQQLKLWQDMGFVQLRLSVNISARQLQEYNMVETVSEVLKSTGFDPDFLELEITENSIMRDTKLAMETVKQLKKMGIRIAIDDFGTGFSSLSYIRQFSADVLKIDRSFIWNVTQDSDDAAMTTAIIQMARSLNIKVVAEGVETKEQLAFLCSRGCKEIQGYLISPPVDAQAFHQLLIKGISEHSG